VQLEEDLALYQASGHRFYLTLYLAYQAKANAMQGEIQRGLDIIADALDLAEGGDRLFEAELHRLQGELLLAKGEEGQAEVSFHRAIQVAADQEARSLELRAAMSLARLWQRQGRQAEAYPLLAGIYSWFSEGFDTPDLQEAKALLDQLRRPGLRQRP
jgi:predicted ATPase